MQATDHSPVLNNNPCNETANKVIDIDYIDIRSKLTVKTEELNPNPVFYKDQEELIWYCNPAFLSFFQLSDNEVIGRSISEVCSSDFVKALRKAETVLRRTKKDIYEVIVDHVNGKECKITIRKSQNKHSEYPAGGLFVYISDITELIMLEKQNNRLMNLNKTMFEISRIIVEKNDILEICRLVLGKMVNHFEKADIGSVLLFDKSGYLRMAASMGYNVEQCKNFRLHVEDSYYYKINKGEISGAVIINDIQSRDWDRYPNYWKKTRGRMENAVLVDCENYTEMEAYARPKESSCLIKVESSICTPLVLNGELYGFIDIDSTQNKVFHDFDVEVMENIKYLIEVGISKYKLYEETVFLSRHDTLTGVYNRGYFDELFYDLMKQETESAKAFILAIFDLNGLKTINDFFGHLIGDEIILNFSAALSACMRKDDILGRLGGDEFGIVFFDIQPEEIKSILENANGKFKSESPEMGGKLVVQSFSYGMATYPEDGRNYKDLFKIADENMYEYKNAYKNNCKGL